MKVERSLIKYYAVAAVSLLCTITHLVIRIVANAIQCSQKSEWEQNKVPILVLYFLLILITVAAFSPCLIAKTKRAIRLAVCFSTLFAAVVSVNAPAWYYNLMVVNAHNWSWPDLVYYFALIIFPVATLVMTALDDRKENGAAQDQ